MNSNTESAGDGDALRSLCEYLNIKNATIEEALAVLDERMNERYEEGYDAGHETGYACGYDSGLDSQVLIDAE